MANNASNSSIPPLIRAVNAEKEMFSALLHGGHFGFRRHRQHGGNENATHILKLFWQETRR